MREELKAHVGMDSEDRGLESFGDFEKFMEFEGFGKFEGLGKRVFDNFCRWDIRSGIWFELIRLRQQTLVLE